MRLKKSSEAKSRRSSLGPRISVIIPTLNSWETLCDSIISIQKQTVKPFEIIVVDNASTDGTFERIQQSKFNNQNYKLKFKIVRNKTNLGVTGGRNSGIKNADKRTDYLLFFDHDMVADKNMIKELVHVATLDPQNGIINPKIYYWEDKKRIWAAGTGINLWTGQVIFRGGKDLRQYNKIEEVAVAPAAMLVKRSVINSLGQFDDKYFATFEDTDFCFRARAQGFTTIYTPKAIAYHKIPLDIIESKKRLLSRAYLVGRNRVIFMRRFGKSFVVFLFFLPLFSLYYLYLSLRYRMPLSGLSFFKGTISGLLIK